MMRLFRRKARPDVLPCCPDAARIAIAVGLIDDALHAQSELHEGDRDYQLIGLALDVREILAPTHVTGRPQSGGLQ